MWYQWSSIQSFNAWHNHVCSILGIPYPGRNAVTGEVDESAQWTTAYAEPVIVNNNDVRVFLNEFTDEAERFGAVLSDMPNTLQEGINDSTSSI